MVTARAAATVVLVRGTVPLLSWPLPLSWAGDVATIEVLARWQLEARRRGCAIQVRGACPAVVELIELSGLEWSPDNQGGIVVTADDFVPPASS